jgi:hypothetical protein
MNKKILIASIFATLMLLIPISSAVNVNVDVDDEANDNYKISLDDICTLINYLRFNLVICTNISCKL